MWNAVGISTITYYLGRAQSYIFAAILICDPKNPLRLSGFSLKTLSIFCRSDPTPVCSPGISRTSAWQSVPKTSNKICYIVMPYLCGDIFRKKSISPNPRPETCQEAPIRLTMDGTLLPEICWKWTFPLLASQPSRGFEQKLV